MLCKAISGMFYLVYKYDVFIRNGGLYERKKSIL